MKFKILSSKNRIFKITREYFRMNKRKAQVILMLIREQQQIENDL